MEEIFAYCAFCFKTFSGDIQPNTIKLSEKHLYKVCPKCFDTDEVK